MFVSQFVFFDQTSTSTTSSTFANANNGEALTLQVDDFGLSQGLSLQIEGAVDMNNPDDYFPIKVISLENFRSKKKIDSAGIYMVIISGISKIRIKSEGPIGNFKAYAVSIS